MSHPFCHLTPRNRRPSARGRKRHPDWRLQSWGTRVVRSRQSSSGHSGHSASAALQGAAHFCSSEVCHYLSHGIKHRQAGTDRWAKKEHAIFPSRSRAALTVSFLSAARRRSEMTETNASAGRSTPMQVSGSRLSSFFSLSLLFSGSLLASLSQHSVN